MFLFCTFFIYIKRTHSVFVLHLNSGLKPNANMPEKLRRRKLALAKKGKHLMMLDRKLDTIIKTLQKVPQTDVEELYRKLAEQELVIAAMQNDIDAKNYQIKLLQEELETLRSVNIPSHESPPKTDGPCHFYDCTGFTYDQFNSLCVFFDASTAKPPEIVFPSRIAFDCSSIPQRNQILLTLVKLRLNVDNEKFASQFQIGLPTVNGVLTTWVDYMYDQLSQLSTWPHRDTIFQNMPEGFKQHFPNTFAILSLIELQTELKPEKPDSLQPVTLTSGTTLKSLIACDPRGVVMYVSDLFPGSWSGREIFQKCNIEKLLRGCIQCGYLNAGDGLMVDKSLPIKDDVESIGLRMNIPPLDRMEPYDEETKMSEIFAEQLIHPQRAAAEIKRFQILSDATSMSQFGNANQVWHVVSMLANFVSHNFIK